MRRLCDPARLLCCSLVVSCPSLRLLLPSEMVYSNVVIEGLIGRLAPDRRVTVVTSGTCTACEDHLCYGEGLAPTDGYTDCCFLSESRIMCSLAVG